MTQTNKQNDHEVQKNIAKGAAGIAVAAGVVAAGMALSNKETRKKVAKTAGKVVATLSETSKAVRDELQEESKQLLSEYNQGSRKTEVSRKD